MKTLGTDIQQLVPQPTSHGSPFDRGGADSYYRRGFDPHWYPGGTYQGERRALLHFKCYAWQIGLNCLILIRCERD